MDEELPLEVRKFARIEADKAIDALPMSASMETYVDTWIAAYKKAGGRTMWEKS